MLADDEITIVEGFKQLFDWEQHGYTIVCEAHDGVSAVNLAREHRPDIIMMDINMPLLSGLEAIRVISQELPDTAFIVVSGYDDFEYAREALRLEVVDYMLKPVRFEELSGVLERVRIRRMESFEKQAQSAPQDPAPAGRQIYKIIAYLNGHLGENVTLQSLAEEFYLNPTYISQLFKQETGMNYYAYLTSLRINEAKKLLKNTDLSVSQVAAQAGFNDYRVFTKVFKKQENTLPSKYRQQQRNG